VVTENILWSSEGPEKLNEMKLKMVMFQAKGTMNIILVIVCSMLSNKR
jgi:hypothetical protein